MLRQTLMSGGTDHGATQSRRKPVQPMQTDPKPSCDDPLSSFVRRHILSIPTLISSIIITILVIPLKQITLMDMT